MSQMILPSTPYIYIIGVGRRLGRLWLWAMLWSLSATLHGQPLALLDTIARNNPTLRAAQAGRQAAEAANRTDTRLPDPEAEVAYLVGSPKGVPGRTNVSLTQSLDWGVLTKRRQLLAEAADRTAASQYREARRVVLGEALQQLVLLIHANRTLAELDSRLSLASQVEQLCQKKLEQGALTELELNKARLNVAMAKADRQRACDERETVLARLRTLNGGQPLHCADTLYSLPARELCLAGTSLTAVRPAAVEGAEAAVSQAQAELKLAQTQQWPTFNVGFQGEYIRQNNYSGLSLGLSLPLWGNGRAEVRRRKAELLATQLNLADIQQQAGASQLQLSQTTRRLLQVADELHQGLLATQNTQLLQRALQAGQISLLDYLLECSFYYSARTAWLEAERDAYLAAAELYALGL